MSKRFTVTLAEASYNCRPFNIGELEDLAEQTTKLPTSKVPFAMLYAALTKCAEPPLTEEVVKAIVAPNGEVQAAMVSIMQANGIATAPGE